MAIIYIDEGKGIDAHDTQGTEAAPFKSLSQAYLERGPDDEYQVKKKDEEEYKPAAKSALKKAASYADQQRKKRDAAAKRAEKEAHEKAALEAAVEQAKSIKITENPALPEAVLINIAEADPRVVGQLRKSSDEPKEGVLRVRVQGRVQRVAKQGGLIFVTLRRGLNLMQCLLSGKLAKTHDALTLARETSMEFSGELWEVPAGAHAPLNRELHADYFRIIAKAPGGDDSFVNRVPEDADSNTLLNLRHLALRCDKPRAIMFVRDVLESAFHTAYRELDFKKVSTPALVQTQVEGGATLFTLNYYGEKAFLTQSSQLYLETVLPSLGDVYCIEKSSYPHMSLARTACAAVPPVEHIGSCLILTLLHGVVNVFYSMACACANETKLSEYTHIEAELDFITFDDLLAHLEHLICRVIDLTLENPIAANAIKTYNPEFTKPSRPFLRMRYSEAIDWLRAKGIKNEDGNDHVFGDDM
jgi:asparaginyl-tRNA synthetase